MDVISLMDLMKAVGVPVAMLLFFIWVDLTRRKREDKERGELAEKLNSLEDYHRNELTKMVVENTTALQNHADASKEMSRASKHSTDTNKLLIQAMRTRPCLKDDIEHIERDAG